MAWTQAQVEEIEARILELATAGMKAVTINGRSYTKRDLGELEALRDRMLREIRAASGGGRTLARLRRAR